MNNIKRFFVFFLILCVLNPQNTLASSGDVPQMPKPNGIVAWSAVLMDAKTGVIIYEKNMNDKLYPASITKLMTVLLLLEYADGNYSERIVFSHYSVYSLPVGTSHIAMDENESLTLEQALYGILLASANEVSNAVAEHIAGSVEEFASMMTERAADLGATGTVFQNPHGLHDDGHYTTAHDMALIMRELLKYDYFKEIIATRHYEIPPTERQPKTRPLNNSHKMIQPGQYFYSDVIGGKTGFTDEAAHTLATYAVRDDMELIAVVMKDEKNMTYVDTASLFDFGFGMFEPYTVPSEDSRNYNRSITVIQPYEDAEADVSKIEVNPEGQLTSLLPATVKSSDISAEYDLPESLVAPVRNGQKVGTLVFNINGYKLGELPLIAAGSVEVAEAAEVNRDSGGIELSNYQTIAILAAALTLLSFIFRRVSIYRHKRYLKRRRKSMEARLSKQYRYR